MEKLKELFEIIDFHYGDLVTLRNELIESDFGVQEYEQAIDHILDVFDELKEKESE